MEEIKFAGKEDPEDKHDNKGQQEGEETALIGRGSGRPLTTSFFRELNVPVSLFLRIQEKDNLALIDFMTYKSQLASWHEIESLRHSYVSIAQNRIKKRGEV